MSNRYDNSGIQSSINPDVKNIDKNRAAKFVVDPDVTKKSLTIASNTSGLFFTEAKNVNQFSMIDISIDQTSSLQDLILTIDFGFTADTMVQSYSFSYKEQNFIQSIPIQGNYFNFNIFNFGTDTANIDVKLQFRNYMDYYPKNQIQYSVSPNAIAQLTRVGNNYYDDIANNLTGNVRRIYRTGRINNLPSYPSTIYMGTGTQASIDTSNTIGLMKFETLTTPSATDDGQIQIIGITGSGEREYEIINMVDGEGTSSKQYTFIEQAECQQNFQPTQDIKIIRDGTTDLYNYIPKGPAMTQTPLYVMPAGATSSILKSITFRGFVGYNPSPLISLVQKRLLTNKQIIKRYQIKLVDNNNIDITVPLNLKLNNRSLIYFEVTSGETIGAGTELDLVAEMEIIEDYTNGASGILQLN